MNRIYRFKSIVFDLDGTLLDTLPALVNTANAVLEQAGAHAVSQEALRPALSQGLRAFFAQALALQTPSDNTAWPAAQLEAEFMQRCGIDALAGSPPYDGVVQMLNALRAQGFSLGVCTNRDPQSARDLLMHAEIFCQFDTLVGIGDASEAKPAAAPLLLALEKLQCSPSEALMVGDSSADAQCAQAAGVAFAAHTQGYASRMEELLPCLWAFSSFHELAQHLKKSQPQELQHG